MQAKIAQRSGVPKAILSDHGSDLKLGITLLQIQHPDVIGLYDVTHKLALLLKAILEADANWLEFKSHCGTTKAAIQQTSLAHLAPPKFKTKGRYMNVSEQIRWGQDVCLLLQHRGAGNLSPEQQADLPADWLKQKLGWVASFADSLVGWSELMRLGEQVCSIVRHKGYTSDLAGRVAAAVPVAVSECGQQLRTQLLDFIESECRGLPTGSSLPGSSEVIESLIGKGKRLEGQQSQSGFTRYVLGLAASVVTPSVEILKSVSQSVGTKHVSHWLEAHLPQSVQAKRIRDLGHHRREQIQDKQLNQTAPSF